MTRISRSVEIEAGQPAVWSQLADLESVATWNPNVSAAGCGPVSRGVGATRTCELVPTGRLEETASEWVEGEAIWFAVGSHGGIRSADMGTVLSSDGSATTVTATVDYHLAFGPLGPVIDRLTTRRLMARMMDAALAGLKEHIESIETTRGTDHE